MSKKKVTSSKPTPVPQKKDQWNLFIPLMLIVVTLLVYWNAGQAGFVNWDDTEYILNDQGVQNLNIENLGDYFSSFRVANYHPLTTLSWAIEYSLYGADPSPYHWFNIFLHLLNTLLVFVLFKKLLKDQWPAALVAALFALHPMHVESVAWISERKDVLYTAFFLGSLIVYMRYLGDRKQTRWYFISLVLFIFSLLSKSAAVVLPLVLLLLDYHAGRKFDSRCIFEKVPFLVLSLLFGILAYFAQQSMEAINSLVAYNYIDRIFLVLYAPVFYLFKAIIPVHLSAVHFYPEKIGAYLPWYIYLSPLLYLILVIVIVRFKKIRKELIFGLLLFMINIVLVIQIIPLGRSLVAERYTYLPYLGLFYLIATVWKSFRQSENQRMIRIFNTSGIFLVLFVISLSVGTYVRVKVWNNTGSLFLDVCEKYPENYYGFYQTATNYYGEGQYEKAIEYFGQSLLRKPDDHDAWNNRGNACYMMGNNVSAIHNYSMAIRIFPEFASAWHNRGSVYASMQIYPQAVSDYSHALKIRPNYTDAYYNRGLVYNLMKKYEAAIPDFSKAIELNPKMAKAYYDRGASEIYLNRKEEGCRDMKTALDMGFEKAADVLRDYCGGE